MKIQRLIQTSRPRFWIYALGTFLLGVAAAMPHAGYGVWMYAPILLFCIFFTYPANLFTYGVNDIFDYETDRLNPKKVSYESLILPQERRTVWLHIALACLPFIIYSVVALPLVVTLSLVFFFVCAGSYSIPPIRAKARPFFDSFISGLHYVSPGIVGYVLTIAVTGMPFSYEPFLLSIVGGFLWSAAMHAFSAIPDIDADKKAGVATIATSLGKMKTIIFCITLYALSAIVIFPLLGIYAIVAAILYIGLLLYAAGKDAKRLFAVYEIFPFVNTFVGMGLFFFALLK